MERICQKCKTVNPSAEGLESDACPNCGAIYSKVEKVLALQAKLAAQETARANEQEKIAALPTAQGESPPPERPKTKQAGGADFFNQLPRPLLYFCIWFIATLILLMIPGLGIGALFFMMCIGVIMIGRAVANRAVGRTIICPNPNCGYRGKALRRSRGSTLVGLILCMLFLLPGLIYFILKSGYRYFCPNCNLQIGSDS